MKCCIRKRFNIYEKPYSKNYPIFWNLSWYNTEYRNFYGFSTACNLSIYTTTNFLNDRNVLEIINNFFFKILYEKLNRIFLRRNGNLLYWVDKTVSFPCITDCRIQQNVFPPFRRKNDIVKLTNICFPVEILFNRRSFVSDQEKRNLIRVL